MTLNYRLGLLGFLRTGLQVTIIILLLVFMMVLLTMVMIPLNKFTMLKRSGENGLTGSDDVITDDENVPLKHIDNAVMINALYLHDITFKLTSAPLRIMLLATLASSTLSRRSFG